MTDTDRKFNIDDLTLGTLEFVDMSLGDIEDICAAAGIDIATFGGMLDQSFNTFPPKALSAFIWVENRNKMKGLTLEDVRGIPATKLVELLGTENDDDTPKERLTPDTS